MQSSNHGHRTKSRGRLPTVDSLENSHLVFCTAIMAWAPGLRRSQHGLRRSQQEFSTRHGNQCLKKLRKLAFGVIAGKLDLLKGFSGEVRFGGRSTVGVRARYASEMNLRRGYVVYNVEIVEQR